MKLHRSPAVAFAAIAWSCASPLLAASFFEGIDAGAGPGASRPNSSAAAASFAAAAGSLGTVQVINFESAPLGQFASLGVAPGVTAILQGASTTEGGILNTLGDSILGYNTTAGGSRYLSVRPIFDIGTASLTFNFGSPINAFGSDITGLGTANGSLFILYNDGASQTIPIAGSSLGGAKFFGFTAPGAAIVQVKLELRNVIGTRDIFSVDDVRYTAVPEPLTLTMMVVVSAIGICGLRFTNRKP